MAHLMLTGLLLASPSAPLFEYEDQLGLDDPARWMLTAPNQIPRNVRVTTKHNKIPDVASLSAWYTVLSMKARDVFYKIAQKDIECHPLKIMMRSGEYASDDYYFLSIKNLLRAIKIEGPDLQIIEMDSYENVGTKAEVLQFNRKGSSIRVRKSIIASHNLWRDDLEGRGVGYDVYISDSLQSEIKKAKLTGVKFTELIET